MISEIITQLKQLKYIDDAKFSSWLVESRSRSRPRGKRLLVREMKAKGISADDIKVEIDETSLAGKALEKKLHVWKSLPYKEFKTKSYRFLAARGFPWEVIERVTRKLYNGQDVTDED
ncbi:hypothetical protein A2397_02680 [Candidatus Amesbacteria bacterium RIFOXYB1_FULL_44_23]|uniref:Regulatory protein RecX n=1 Tax=Candidatus Amesbacteria bacterium RIFOXYB1_FULL_44_23 TaxID=1797263 RepID=A0A1F4ZXV8_9BACT|nr:MAG: hypothetical protein A2397_02680 [Candidatus Amesbacteria bacterium RIFOXYB1_FULL_44_23]